MKAEDFLCSAGAANLGFYDLPEAIKMVKETSS